MQIDSGKDIIRVNEYESLERKKALKKYYNIEEKDDIKFQEYLYKINLSMYSSYKTPATLLENFLFTSEVDKNIQLHPEQIECLNFLMEGKSLLLSAPTSFGKTFLILEYLFRCKEKFNNILFIVPTIALRNELYAKIQKMFVDDFNIIINNFDKKAEKNIYLLLPERMEEKEFINEINSKEFDVCIIDEVYKLGRKNNDQRKIIFNRAYMLMLKNAKQLILLGPFMKNVEFNRLGYEKKIYKYYSNYSPILNEIQYSERELLQANINAMHGRKQIIFCPTPKKVAAVISEINLENIEISNEYINWLEEMYFPEWELIECLKKGMIYHYGPLPKFLREYIEELYNDESSEYNVIFATSTLLEGINTPTSVMHILDINYTKTRRLNKFELNNLIGRVGRLSSKVKGNVFIYDKDVYNMVEDNFSEEIVFEAESYLYDSYEDAKSLEKDITEDEMAQYNAELKEIESNLPEGELINLEEINMKYYNLFKNSKNQLIEEVKKKNSEFKKQLAILSYYHGNIINKYGDYYYETLLILQGKTIHEVIMSKSEKNECIIKCFKALNFIDYEMGNLINLLQLNILLDDSYKDAANSLTQMYYRYSNKSEVYKTLLDIGFSEYDSENIEKFLLNYEFVNSQELTKIIVKNQDLLTLSPFGKWKINKLQDNIKG